SRTIVEPPTWMPCAWARRARSLVGSPSAGGAFSVSSGRNATPVEKNSGSTTHSAPSFAAWVARRSQSSRLWSMSPSVASVWTAAALTAFVVAFITERYYNESERDRGKHFDQG